MKNTKKKVEKKVNNKSRNRVRENVEYVLRGKDGKINKIEVTQGELVEALSAQARQYPGYEKQIFEIYRKNEKLIDSLRAPIFENKVIDFILDKSDVKEITVKMDELMSSSE